jgi:hypothetical protein
LDYVTSVKPSTLLSQGDYPCRVEVDYKVTKRDEDFISMSKERYLKLLSGYEAWQNHD